MKTQLAIVGMIITLSTLAQAGGVGNGGVAYVCRDPQSQAITTVRLLDLWEPETQTIPQSNDQSVQVQLRKAIELLGTFFPHGKTELTRLIKLDESRTLMSKKALTLTTDALPSYGPGHHTNCKFEQVALHGYDYELRKVILKIDNEIYNSLAFSNTDRAALWVHEALYEVARKFWDVRDSRFVRSIVATLFSKDYMDYRKIDPGLRYAIAQLFIHKDCNADIYSVLDLTSKSKCDAITLPLIHQISGHTIELNATLPGIDSVQKKWMNQLNLAHPKFIAYLTHGSGKNLNHDRIACKDFEYKRTPVTVSDSLGGGSYNLSYIGEGTLTGKIESLWDKLDSKFRTDFPQPTQIRGLISSSQRVFNPSDELQKLAFNKPFVFSLDKPVYVYTVLLSRPGTDTEPADEVKLFTNVDGINLDYYSYINP